MIAVGEEALCVADVFETGNEALAARRLGEEIIGTRGVPLVLSSFPTPFGNRVSA
jgi:hypothetical protein